jgi:hypothetical protein
MRLSWIILLLRFNFLNHVTVAGVTYTKRVGFGRLKKEAFP